MDLFIIRHAQSSNNALADESRRVVDPPLTALGKQQAALLAAHLAAGTDRKSGPCEAEPPNGGNHCEFAIKKLYTSAMRRALETVTPISRALGLPAQVWVEIHEHGGMWLNHGEPRGVVGYPGMARDEIAARFPDACLPDAITEAGWYDPGKAYESWEQARERAERVAAQLRAWPDPDDHIALVTHGGFSSLLLAALFSASAPEIFFHHDNTGLTRVRFREDGRISLRYQNRVTHLPAHLIT